jgi:hypothetical protein
VKLNSKLASSLHVAIQGKGSGGNRTAKENTAPTDIRDKVGSPDPGMDIFGLRLLPKAQSQESFK